MIARTREEADVIERGLKVLADKGVISKARDELEEIMLERYCRRYGIEYTRGFFPPGYPYKPQFIPPYKPQFIPEGHSCRPIFI